VSRSAPWRIAEVLDFEHLLSADAEIDKDQLRQRDRTLYVEQIAPHLPPDRTLDRATVFREWVQRRRGSLGSAAPGTFFNTGWQTLLSVAVVGGLLLGGGVTAGLLHYPENEPVNAIEFLKWTLLPQWLFLAGALLFLVLRRGLGEQLEPLRAMLRMLIALFAAGLRRLPGDQRAAAHRTFARVRDHRDRYGSLATWPLVIATQVFAVCFNLGTLGTLLTEVTVRELRFGWQTTLEVQPAQVAEMVRAASWPWSWAPQAHPTLGQIAATRYAPGQRHDTLQPEAMRSWWPFLAYAIVLYGFGVRGALLLLAAGKLRAALHGLSFNFPEANALWHRMLGPVIASNDSPEQMKRAPSEALKDTESHARAGACWVLMAQDLPVDEAALRGYLENTYRWQVARVITVQIDNRRGNQKAIEEIRAATGSLSAVVVAAPAQRDPIVAIALFLKDVVGALGQGTEGLLLLAGSAADLQCLPFWRDFNAEHRLGLSMAPWQTP
jgi:hypothetical protein